jgi:hypothetical protein
MCQERCHRQIACNLIGWTAPAPGIAVPYEDLISRFGFEVIKRAATGDEPRCRRVLGSVRRFTDNNRFAGGARSDLLLGRRRLNCGHPDLTGLDPGNMPR